MFGLRDAEIVREVARCGGFRAAAQKLRLSQSAVSTRIAETEQRLGIELFDRKRHGARLTPIGRRFLDQAERLIEMRDQIVTSLLPSSGFAGTIRIGVAESIVHTLLPNMLGKIRDVFPDARLELSVDLSPVLARRLVDDDIDVAILVSQLVPAGAIEVACPGGSASVSAGSGSYVLTEPCARVAVAGNAIILETGGVAIDTLLVQGDGNTISGSGVAGTVTLEGQDNVVATGRADDVTIRGQRNSLTSADRIATLEIAGSANTIAAPGIGTSTVSGDGNTYPGS